MLNFLDENKKTTLEYHSKDIEAIMITLNIPIDTEGSFGSTDANKLVMNIAVFGFDRMVINPLHQFEKRFSGLSIGISDLELDLYELIMNLIPR